jgi:outer membrane scaffolding protein for murein synthesis (MipA/OmpV family)
MPDHCCTTRIRFLAALTGLAAASQVALAQGSDDPLVADPVASASPSVETATSSWEGAVGLTASYRPEYNGSSRQTLRLKPALYLRWGRVAITNASDFAVRRAEQTASGGLGVDVLDGDRFSVSGSLRYETGRKESSSDTLAGMGDIRPTVRGRVAATWRLGGPWRLTGSVGPDLIGHGGGTIGDLGVAWDRRLSPTLAWTVGSSVLLADRTFMRLTYGVDEAQAARSGYPVYQPGAGGRDVVAYTSLRVDIDREWTVLGGASAHRLIGPAAESPLTRSREGWSVNAGLAWRFH